jgi:asparagine synthase (glutamine-hydrolysing)
MGGALQDLLRYADRNSMAHSLEVRLPFLSHELVEFVFSLPSTYKINEGWTKYIMRHSLGSILPKEITWRVDKIGYEPPQKKWMERSDVKDQIMTTKMALVKEGILDKGEVNKPISAVSAEASGLNDWRCWMAGELNKTKHA